MSHCTHSDWRFPFQLRSTFIKVLYPQLYGVGWRASGLQAVTAVTTMEVLLGQKQPIVRWKFRQLPRPIVTSLWILSPYLLIQAMRRQRNQWMWCGKLPQHVISRHGDAPWPAGSPDLSGCDCFLEGYFWHKVNYTMANRGAPSNIMRRNLGDPSSNDMPHTGKPSKSAAGLWGMAGGVRGIRF